MSLLLSQLLGQPEPAHSFPPQGEGAPTLLWGGEMLGAAAVALSEGLPSAGGGCFLPPALIMRCNLSGGRDTACFDGG